MPPPPTQSWFANFVPSPNSNRFYPLTRGVILTFNILKLVRWSKLQPFPSPPSAVHSQSKPNSNSKVKPLPTLGQSLSDELPAHRQTRQFFSSALQFSTNVNARQIPWVAYDSCSSLDLLVDRIVSKITWKLPVSSAKKKMWRLHLGSLCY